MLGSGLVGWLDGRADTTAGASAITVPADGWEMATRPVRRQCSIIIAKMRWWRGTSDASNGGDQVGGWAAAACAPTALAPPLLGCGRHEQWTRALASSSRCDYCWPLADGAIVVPLPRHSWANPANSVMGEAATLETSKWRVSGKGGDRSREQAVCEA